MVGGTRRRNGAFSIQMSSKGVEKPSVAQFRNEGSRKFALSSNAQATAEIVRWEMHKLLQPVILGHVVQRGGAGESRSFMEGGKEKWRSEERRRESSAWGSP